MYSNVIDTIYCETPEMAEKLFNFLRSEGYSTMMASAEINTGTKGNYAAKQLTIFKPEEEQKYNLVGEILQHMDEVLKQFKDKPCTFNTGCDAVMEVGLKTLFNTDDWGVYENEETGNVTIYNGESEEVISLMRGVDSGDIVATSYRVTTLARMAGVPDRWNVDLNYKANKSVTKSRAIGLSELTEEELNDLTKGRINMDNTISSWTVFFLFEPITTVYTTLLTERDDVSDEELINLAYRKLKGELGIDVYELASELGKSSMTDSGNWIVIEHNDTSATDHELAVLKVNK